MKTTGLFGRKFVDIEFRDAGPVIKAVTVPHD